jgi:lysophospholipid hydrolase
MTVLDETSSTISVSPDKSSIPLPSDEDPTSNPRKTGSRHLSFAIGPADEFDLRDEVMTCISRSIGLTQPSTSISPSIDSSPVLTAQDASLKRAVFSSSFGSLSYLGIQARDDESSITGSSTTGGLEGMDIENETEILFFPRDSILCKAGERGPGLFFVIEGWLDVLMPESHANSLGKLADNNENQKPTPLNPTSNSRHGSQPMSRSGSTSRNSSHDANLGSLPAIGPKASKPLFSVKPGGIAGYLSSLSGFPSYVDIKAKTDVYVGFLPARALDRIMDRRPIVLLTLAKRLISLLPPLVVHIDSALDWMQVNAGQVIYRQDDKADSFYFVNQGRLRSIADKAGTGGVEILAEYGQGDSVGECRSTHWQAALRTY